MWLQYSLIAFAILLLVRDFVYRLCFIYPITNLKGEYARTIEETDIVKWTGHVIRNRKDLEVGFIGNSHVMDAIDPEIVTRKTGLTSFNLALYYISIPNMIELLHRNKCFPNRMFIDFSTRYSHYSNESSFYENLIQEQYNGKKDVILDSLSCLFPSFFVPRKFILFSKRTFRKLLEFYRNGYPSIGRYTPFRSVVGFDWKVKKNTNHRYATRRNKKSNPEKLFELISLRKSIQETTDRCNYLSSDYGKGFLILEQYISEALKMGKKITFIRLPLNKRLIDFENQHCSFYFEDIKKLAQRYNIDYLDFNLEEDFKQLFPYSFYIDGQHLEHSSALNISNFLSKIIRTEL